MKNFFILFAFVFSFALNAQHHLSKKDSNFVREAEEHTLYEIKLAELAQTKASSPEVRTLASDLLTYHKTALKDLQQLASRKHIQLTTKESHMEQKHYDKLNKKQGMDFDKAYTRCVAKTHKWGSWYLKKEASKAKDSDIKAWAAANYTLLEQDSNKAKATCKAIKNKK